MKRTSTLVVCPCGCGQIHPLTITHSKPRYFLPGHHGPIAYKREPLETRFWRQVSRTDDPDACWEWQGERSRAGYGRLFIEAKQGKIIRTQAHRYSWTLAHGPAPEGFYVCHHCDNPPCCNPRHLFISDAKGNMQDAVLKGRMSHGAKHYCRTHPEKVSRGERFPRARLTEVQVLEIRRMWASGKYVLKEIAAQFGHSIPGIANIVHGRCWKHLL